MEPYHSSISSNLNTAKFIIYMILFIVYLWICIWVTGCLHGLLHHWYPV